MQNQLRNMQYDENLSHKQKKLANEFYKELYGYPNWPFVHFEVVAKMIAKVGEA